jgi:NAD(P) transhydrogenase subunit alpha
MVYSETSEGRRALDLNGRPELTFVIALTLFVVASYLGTELIVKVPPTLHTPLMSGSNAISGITIVGALLATGAGHSTWALALGFVAVTLATIHAVSGFLVTNRMLDMFRRKGRGDS